MIFFALIMGAGMLPMKNGGVASLANRPGYSFGSKVLKKFGPVGNIYNKGIANIKKGFDTVKGKLGTTKNVTETVPKQGPYTAGGNIYSKGYPGGTKIGTGPGTAEVSKSIYQPGGFLSYIAKSPEGQLAQKIYQGRGFIGKPIKATAKFVGSSPTALIGLTYAGGKYLLPDGTEANKEQIENAKTITNAAKGGAGTGKVEKTQAEIDAEKAATDKKKLDRIYSLLGVKRAQANAASKALIDMSRYIDEGGRDVISKKNLGSTISKGIGAFDKRLDKADQLKEAAGLMMAKSEIEAMSDPYSKQYKKLSVEKLEKEARDSKDPRALKLALFDAKNKTLTHDGAVSLAKTNNPNAVVLADAEEAKDLGIGKDKSAIQYVQEQVVSQGGDVEGVYVVDKVIIKVDSQGNATQLLP
jgi:hypothetical protein